MGTFGKSRQYHLHTGRRCTPFRLSSERTQAAPLLDRPQTSYLAGAAVFLTFFTSGVAQGRAALRLNSHSSGRGVPGRRYAGRRRIRVAAARLHSFSLSEPGPAGLASPLPPLAAGPTNWDRQRGYDSWQGGRAPSPATALGPHHRDTESTEKGTCHGTVRMQKMPLRRPNKHRQPPVANLSALSAGALRRGRNIVLADRRRGGPDERLL